MLATSIRAVFVLFAILLNTAGIARANTIVLFAPLSGDFGELGEQFKLGAELSLAESNFNIRLEVIDTACDPATLSTKISDLDITNIRLMAGFYCSDVAKVVATQFSDSGIPILVSGARSVRLIKDRERESWNLWRMAPGDDFPTATAARAIVERWKDTPFALVDDGTIYGRSFSDNVRSRLDEADAPPQFSDTFRAAQSTQAGLLRRLQRSGVTAAFIASATTEDIVNIARDAANLDINVEIITTEAMMVLPFLEEAKDIPAGLQVIGWPLPEAPRLDAKLRETNTQEELAIYQGFATMEIALAALGDSNAETISRLTSTSFETVLGEIGFNANGSSSFNPYQLLEWNGTDFVPAPPAPTQ